MASIAFCPSRYGLSEGSPTEKGLRLDAQVFFKGRFTGTALVTMRQQLQGLPAYLPTNFSNEQNLDGTGLYQEAPSDFRDKVDRIRPVDWRRSVDRYCCQERGQVFGIDHRKHLPQSCKSPLKRLPGGRAWEDVDSLSLSASFVVMIP